MNSSTIVIVVAIAVIVILAVLAWTISRRRQSEQLKEKFGPEYDYTLNKTGDQRQAEEELAKREKRIEALDIHDLSAEQRDMFAREWQAIQAQFVDDPKGSVERADGLIQEVMKERGFPVADFEQRAADISVLHPNVVPNYRQGHEIAQRSANAGGASTEDLRQAMVYYRSLFEELLHQPETQAENKERTL
jgi:FtsZ-interacting cell division protein ZipA